MEVPGSLHKETMALFKAWCQNFMLPEVLAPLIKCLWNAKYPSFPWTNDAAIGSIFEQGSPEIDELTLAGSIVTGSITKSNGNVVWAKVQTTEDLRPYLNQGDTIRVGAERVLVQVVVVLDPLQGILRGLKYEFKDNF